MQVFFTLTRRELATYFVSITGYVIIAAATFLVGGNLVVLLRNLGGAPTPMPVTELFFSTLFFWVIVVLAAPVITMRTFALEKYSGTYENLMTTPVSDLQVVVAKFTAGWLFYLIMWLPMVACLYIVQYFAKQSGALEPGMMAGMLLGNALVGALFIALGSFASAMTNSQMVAAMLTLVLGASLVSLAFVAEQVTVTNTWQSQLLGRCALFTQMQDFARGVIDTRPIVFFSSLTFLFLFLTLRVVESRRWK